MKRTRRPLIAGNWKMNLGRVDEALAFVRRIRPGLSETEGIDVLLCPPFTVLATLSEVLRPSRISLGAQNLHWQAGGAHTGEISPSMLREVCRYVIVGHSERRAAGESDEQICLKITAAIEHGLVPVLCVGETGHEKEAGETGAVLERQLRSATAGLEPERVEGMVLAYEPVWAIGTGLSATPAEANRTIGLIVRGTLADRFGEALAQRLRILYGGSVDESNIAAFMTQPEIDGALVGGASLRPSFVHLVRAAAGA